MRVLVTGGTGTVGSQVVRELLARKATVSVLTRDGAKASALPAGAKAIVGDLRQPETVRRVFADVDAVFLVNVVGPTEAQEGLLAVSGMRLARVQRVVYLSVRNADKAAWLPHFGAKVGVEAALAVAGIPYTVLRPNNFFQNDHHLKDALLQHAVYPQPIGNSGLSRVDVRDIAEAAAVTLLESGHDRQIYDLDGPEVVTGESAARTWSRALGKPVVYAGDDLDAWEQQALTFMPDDLAFDFREMFDYFQKQGLKASPEAVARQTRLLGHAPRSFDAFAEETAASWK
jgi:uncharacterized protein YbjT (DUF2867 family)